MSHRIYNFLLHSLGYLYERVYVRAYGKSAVPPDIKKAYLNQYMNRLRVLQIQLEDLNLRANQLPNEIVSVRGNLEQTIRDLEQESANITTEQNKQEKWN